MTIDIENINIRGTLHPYLIAGYAPKHQILEYANSIDIADVNSMFSSFINKLIGVKRVKTVYAHNLSGFDGIFLLKQLLAYPYSKVEPLIHNGKIISIKFIHTTYEMDKGARKEVVRTITFKDSFLLLPMSLRRLCESFHVDNPKGHFPVLFNDDIHYTGEVPDISFWPGLNYDEYFKIRNEYISRDWDFALHAKYYCLLDCKALFEVLVKFNELVFREFKINVHGSLTLPALAMRIYKANFMPKDTLYQIAGPVDSDIRQSYTGGAVDVFIPSNYIPHLGGFKQLYYYDVNSLYPYIMANLEMPIGKPKAFEGNIRSVLSDAYGFFFCNIESPQYLEHPILQRRIKTSAGIRTIAGLGSWQGWISSVEYDKAISLGYKIQILNGYLFDKAVIFKEYVDKMYSLRLQYKKDNPMNLIAKLLMNSLYGKFGMNTDKTIIEIYNTEVPEELKSLNEVLDIWGEGVSDHIAIDHYVVIIRKNLSIIKHNENEDLFYGSDINVGIASMITAGARMYMATLKNSSNYNLYYTDTDSVVIDRPLPEDKVGSKLGQLKLEHVIERAVFIAPKVYGLLTSTGEEIIKVKGIKHDVLSTVKLQDLANLLHIDSSLEFSQEKWHKKAIEGKITIKDACYNLKATANKRCPIYNDKGIFINTRPYNYDEVLK